VQDFAREHFRAEDCRDLFASPVGQSDAPLHGGRVQRNWLVVQPQNGQSRGRAKLRPGIVIRSSLPLVWLRGVHGRCNAAVQVREAE